MFRDYYAILEIEITASREQIIAAFKFQAKKWHPDKNPDKDTTERMQLINEAFIILNDAEARQKYDIEYKRYKDQSSNQKNTKEKPFEERKFTNDEYVPQDEILKKWMANAKKQAAELVKETIEDIRKMGAVGAKAAGKEMANYLIYLVIFSLIVMIFFAIKEGIKRDNNSRGPATADATKDIIPEVQNQTAEFTSLSNEYITKYLFNGEYTVNDDVYWSPNDNERTIFPVSANGYCYTAIDTIHYIYDNENSLSKAVVVFSTFRKDNKGEREGCHACSPYVSIAIFDRSISIWKLEKFNKQFGAIGSWGYPPATSIGKYGFDKHYIDCSMGYSGQGYLEYGIQHFDLYTSESIFSTTPECISNYGAIGYDNIDKLIEYSIEANYMPNSNDF